MKNSTIGLTSAKHLMKMFVHGKNGMANSKLKVPHFELDTPYPKQQETLSQ